MITGSSGSGKTTLLRKIFRFSEYGIKTKGVQSVIESNWNINGFQYLPEPVRLYLGLEPKLVRWLNNGNTTIADVNPRFKDLYTIVDKYGIDYKEMLLDSTDKEIRRNLTKRNASETTIQHSLKYQETLRKSTTGLNVEEMEEYLLDLVGVPVNEQGKLF